MECVIDVQGVSKSYKTAKKGAVIEALRDISFKVNKGEIFGLIGPDGAGKTTLFRIIATLLLANKGDVYLNGNDVRADYRSLRDTIGYMPGRFSLYTDLSVEENLHFFATLFHTSIEANYDQIKEIYMQLEPFKTRRAGALSGGMKQKLALCCALIHKPSILLLDEPTTGVDPVSRKEFWDMLGRLKEQGMTIVVSTPYMDEAARCDRMALMLNGVILNEGTPDELTRAFPYPLWLLQCKDVNKTLGIVRSFDGVGNCFSFGDSLHLWFADGVDRSDALKAFLQSNRVEVDHLELLNPSIEDYFILLCTQHLIR